jgi:hypothetical protein
MICTLGQETAFREEVEPAHGPKGLGGDSFGVLVIIVGSATA